MKKLPIVTSFLALSFSFSVLAENNYMPEYVEKGLIEICKSSAKDKLMNMNKAIKDLRIKHKTVALNVVCNGQDIISFSERYGAKRTTAKLNRSIGSVKVTDIAAISNTKYDVTFKF